VLARLCLDIVPSALGAVCLVGTVVAFGLAHVEFGWAHVSAKTFLATMALASVVLTGSVVAAVVGHCLFNANVVRERRERLAC
jgi:hypothetical protein